jgi:hypothetical protein
MSTETKERYCEWNKCTNKATKHLVSAGNGRVVESNNSVGTMAITIRHADLCDEHLQPTRDLVGGHVRELIEECSPECPKGRSSRGGTK